MKTKRGVARQNDLTESFQYTLRLKCRNNYDVKNNDKRANEIAFVYSSAQQRRNYET